MNPMRPWETPVYNAQVKTSSIAKALSGDYRNVTGWGSHLKPPFCLRIVKAYRTEAMQQFRDQVAAAARESRKIK